MLKKEIMQLIGDYIPTSNDIDMSKLSEYHRDVLTNFLIPYNPGVPLSALIQVVNVKSAQILGLNRVKIKLPNELRPIPVNYYGINFMRSGGGKDKPLKQFDDYILRDFNKQFFDQASKYISNENKRLESEAEEIYPKSKTEQAKYVAKNKPRVLPKSISEGTVEGFRAAREAFQRAGFGCTFVKISEFGAYITNISRDKSEFLTGIEEAYDHGDLDAKIIKSESDSFATSGIPSNMILYTSPIDMLEGENNRRLMDFLNGGMARRSFVAYPLPEEFDEREFKSMNEIFMWENEIEEKAQDNIPRILQLVDQVCEQTRWHNVFELTPDGHYTYKCYIHLNKIREREMRDRFDEGLVCELLGRFWKCLKLAGIIAAMNHPEIPEVGKMDMMQAIYLTEYFGLHYQRFYNAKPVTDNRKLYNYLLEHKGRWVTKSEIREQKFVDGRQFRTWFEENMKLALELADIDGKEIFEEKFGKNGVQFKLDDATVPTLDNLNVFFTTSDHMSKNYKAYQSPFNEFHEIITGDENYSAGMFKDNYRTNENYIKSRLIILDFDDGTPTFEEAKKIFSQFTYLIATTKSHKKVKGTKPAVDRFRVILVADSDVVLDLNSYHTLMENLIDKYGADQACKDPARFFYPYKDAEYEYNTGELFPFRNYLTPKNTGKQEVIKQKGVDIKKYEGTGNQLVDVLGTDEALRRYDFYDPRRGYFEGNIDNFLRRITAWLKDEGIPNERIRQEIYWLNSLQPFMGVNTHKDIDLERILRDVK